MADNEIKTQTVYLICHEKSEIGKDVYVGSTSQTPAKRLAAHRSAASRPGSETNKFYKRMREVGLKNWVIRPLLSLESTICSNDDLRKWERMWCEILRSDLNTRLPIRLSDKKSRPTMKTVYLLHSKGSGVGRDVYAGSTSQSLSKRLADHRSNCLRPGNEATKLCKRMREVGPKNWIISPLESTTCSNDDLRKLERIWCEILRSDLNTRLPFQTDEEKREYSETYRTNNREAILRKKPEYRANNHEEIQQKQALYHANNREALLRKKAEYCAKNREVLRQKAAEYREKNRETIQRRNAEYREKNREKINRRNVKHYRERKEKEKTSNI